MRASTVSTVLLSLTPLLGACAAAGAGAAPGGGAPPTVAVGAAAEREIDLGADAGTRRFRLYLPGRRAAAAPLVVMLHGCTQDARDFAAGTGMDALAEEHGFVVLYPEQPASAHPQKCWNWYLPAHQGPGGGEPAAIMAMVRAVTAEQRIDPNRVYVAGVSAGGAMAVILAATHPDVFAAAASHSGIGFRAATDVAGALAAMRSAEPAPGWTAAALPAASRPLPPLLLFHGAADPVVHPANADALLRQWTRGCAAGACATAEEAVEAGGRRATRITARSDGRVLAERWVVADLGHAWSGGSPAGTYSDPAGPSASREIVRFFLERERR